MAKSVQSEQNTNRSPFYSIFEHHKTVMLIIDPDTGAIVDANPAAVNFYGYSRDVLSSMLITDINQLPRDEVETQRKRAQHNEQNSFVFSHKLADGRIRIVEVDSSPVVLDERVLLFSLIHDITERNLAELRFRESEERQKAILNNISDPAWLKDIEGRFLVINKAWMDLYGLRESDVLGKHISEFMFPQLAKQLDAEDRAVISERKVLKNEEAIEDHEHRTRWLETVKAPLIDNMGDIIGITGISRDITERKLAIDALRESEDRYRSLVESSPDGVILHRDGVFLYANSAALEMYGVESFDELKTKTVLDMIHEDDREMIKARIQSAATTRVLPLRETQIIRPDGRILPVETIGSRIHYKGGYANQIIIRDVTERKRREDELNRLNRTYRAISGSSQAMSRAVDESQLMKDVCSIIIDDCCYSMVWIGFAEHDERKSVRPVMYSGFDEGYIDSMDITWADCERGQGPTGTAIRTGTTRICRNMATDPKFSSWRAEALKRGFASSIALPLKTDAGAFGALTIYSHEPDGFKEPEVRLLEELAAELAYGITALRLRAAHLEMEKEIRQSRDMLEQKVIERTAELTKSEERFRNTLDNLMEGCMIVDCSWTYLYVNDAIARQMQCSKRELIGRRITETALGAQSAAAMNNFRTCMEYRIPQEFITELAFRDGSRKWFELHCVPIQEGMFVMSADITERKRAESALQLSNEKLKRLTNRLIEAQEAERRKIAFELHDEIGQVLTAVQLNLHGIVDLDDPKEIPVRLAETLSLTDQLLKQVRELSVDLRPWMLDQLGLVPSIRWYVDKQAQRGKFSAQFTDENLTGRLPQIVEITAYRIVQEAMTNILRYAQASQVRVTLKNTRNWLEGEITDNGIGFSMAELKEKAIGSRGLGMLGMEERVTSLGGTFKIHSSPGTGTSITFRLPIQGWDSN